MKTPLEQVIDICGSQTALADRVTELDASKKITQSTVGAWINRFNHRVGDGYVLVVSQAGDWIVTPHELRPDLYPHPEDGLPAELRKQVA
ncbi:YdaS family helix-turn-helix protein [Methylophilus sp. Leaf414]|uniref:transcriptional regulator n=1 Tax=Methylophilus sp. Leaf414 TaxID=1736371 RepID=UPI0007162169|nr:YdaS family helix-turn-helix protein [Methylophilus sp. Leaf414]KQT37699.1 hypothetical protein ASG24_01500 [Methylophilus sp. Leaf414]